jgi:hypothetical protein
LSAQVGDPSGGRPEREHEVGAPAPELVRWPPLGLLRQRPERDGRLRGRGHTGLEARDHLEERPEHHGVVEQVFGDRHHGRLHHHRHEHLGCRSDLNAKELGWRHADDREGHAGNRDRTADRARIEGEAPLPIAVADHRHRMPERHAVVVWSEHPTRLGPHAEQGKVIAGDHLPVPGRLGVAIDGDVQADGRVRGKIDDAVVIADQRVLLMREAGEPGRAASFPLLEKQQAFGVGWAASAR